MNHKDRLTYCRYCTNRQFDSNRGLICLLTKEKACFETICNDFVKDENELKKSMMGSGPYRLIIDEETDYTFPFLSSRDKLTINLDSLKLYKKAIRSRYLYILFLVLFALSLQLIWIVDVEIIVAISLLILIGAFLILHRKYKENPYLIIDKTGINIKDNKNIPWSNIIRFYFSSFSKKDSNPLFSRTINRMHVETFGNSKGINIDITACGQNLIKLSKKIQVLKNKYT